MTPGCAELHSDIFPLTFVTDGVLNVML